MPTPAPNRPHAQEVWQEAWDNRKLIYSCGIEVCRKHRRYTKDDVFQAGLEGYCRAIENYRPEKCPGAKRSSYIARCVKDYMIKELEFFSDTIYIPRNTRSYAVRYNAGRIDLDSLDKYNRSYCLTAASLVTDHQELPIDDLAALDSEDFSVREHYKYIVAIVLGGLDARERAVIEMAFGLGDRDGAMTTTAISEKFGLTRQWVAWIRKRALAKMRECLPSEEEALCL